MITTDFFAFVNVLKLTELDLTTKEFKHFVCLLMQYNLNICYTMTLILVYLENLV